MMSVDGLVLVLETEAPACPRVWFHVKPLTELVMWGQRTVVPGGDPTGNMGRWAVDVPQELADRGFVDGLPVDSQRDVVAAVATRLLPGLHVRYEDWCTGKRLVWRLAEQADENGMWLGIWPD